MRGWSIIGLGNLKDQGSLADLQAIAADNDEPPTIRAAADAAVRTYHRRDDRHEPRPRAVDQVADSGVRTRSRLPMRGDDSSSSAAEFLQAGRGNDNRIPPPVGILGDAEKTTARIFAQVENKIFPLDGDIFTFQDGVHP